MGKNVLRWTIFVPARTRHILYRSSIINSLKCNRILYWHCHMLKYIANYIIYPVNSYSIWFVCYNKQTSKQCRRKIKTTFLNAHLVLCKPAVSFKSGGRFYHNYFSHICISVMKSHEFFLKARVYDMLWLKILILKNY